MKRLRTSSIGLLILITALLPWTQTPARAASSTLVISEVLYDPSGAEPDQEWIEIYNLGTTHVDLSQYKLGDEETSGGSEGMLHFPSGARLAPGQVAIVAHRATTFSALYGFKPDYEMIASDPTVPDMRNYTAWANGSVALHNDGDKVLLLGPDDGIVDALSWGNSTFAFSPPAVDVADGHALERRPADVDNDSADDWVDQPVPDPGAVHLSQPRIWDPGDSGPGTLRQALAFADSEATVTFDPEVFAPNAPTTIFVRSALPALAQDQVTVDASAVGVILDGSQAPGDTDGLTMQADECVVRGLTVQNFGGVGILVAAGAGGNVIGGDRTLGAGPHGQGNLIVHNGGSGIEIRGDDTLVQGNLVGVDGSGGWDWGNGYNGVAIWEGAQGNVVGGTTAGQRNVIGGNEHNGVWISGAGTDQNVVQGNYIGTRADGQGPVTNGLSGVSIQDGAQHNLIGGTAGVSGNLISGNSQNGIYISDPGTRHNRVLGNRIGTDKNGQTAIGQGRDGVVIRLGASENQVGDGSAAGRNLISGNALDGVRITDSDTVSNAVQGNYIGVNLGGTAALPNGMHGVELRDGAHDNLVGGDRLAGAGNLISGNRNHGVVVTYGAHHNVVAGNLIGPDVTGRYSLGNHPMGGIDVAEGAHDNVIGGLTPGRGNLISGNQTDGLALFTSTGEDTTDNQVLGNVIGLQLDGINALPNGGFGILNSSGAVRTTMVSNTIAFNASYGILIATCDGHTLSQNTIYSNTLAGIRLEAPCLAAPQILSVTLGADEVPSGTTAPDARVEFFSDDADEGRIYEGYAIADETGRFSHHRAGGVNGPNLTATTTDAAGNTSEFSAPTHLLWTLLLYLNGDNDLELYMFDTLTQTAAAGPSPRANVLALVDGYTHTLTTSGTVLYDLTRGAATPLSSPVTLGGERNMGDGQTLIDFVTWGQAHYPARHTLLSIVDHGGGWAPSSSPPSGGSALIRHRGWFAGNSGLSWDFSDGYDYLDSPEIRQALAAITADGADPLDVVFYDVCLMGMIEVAYQIQEYATYFVSSQNIGWAPWGPEGRYVQTVQGLPPDQTPRQMAERLVQIYADTTPPQGHPFTLAALDMTRLPTVTQAVDQLAVALSQTLTGTAPAATLHAAYGTTQKIDYDGDFQIEPGRDGFVDLYDLALQLAQTYTDTAVVDAAQAVIDTLDQALVAEAHQSGTPWVNLDQRWDLDDVHGLSIFLPLGEDLELPLPVTTTLTGTLVLTRNLRLRDMYTPEQLQFASDTAWDGMIDAYYAVAAPVPTATTQGPVTGLLTPDVTPPQTSITLTGALTRDQSIDIVWHSVDRQTGVAQATLWHRPPRGTWTAVMTQTGSAGAFPFTLSQWCENGFAVQAVDQAGNIEPMEHGANLQIIEVQPCHYLFLPLTLKPNPSHREAWH